ncbi:unnamed protein product, partial [Prorocentrum cordatum]
VGRGDSRKPALSAYKALKEKATYAKSLRLAALAAQVHEAKAGHFETVIAAIDKTMQDLKEEETADIAKRDQCKEEITQSNATILDLTWKIKCNEAKIDKLQRKIEEKQAMIAESRQVIKETYAYMNETTDIRTQDNGDFIQAKQNDQNAIELLVKVRDTLSKYYHQNTTGFGTVQGAVKGAALAQQKQEPEFKVSEWEAPDATFSKSTHRIGEAKGVVSLLTMVIEDLNDEIANDMKSEEPFGVRQAWLAAPPPWISRPPPCRPIAAAMASATALEKWGLYGYPPFFTHPVKPLWNLLAGHGYPDALANFAADHQNPGNLLGHVAILFAQVFANFALLGEGDRLLGRWAFERLLRGGSSTNGSMG